MRRSTLIEFGLLGLAVVCAIGVIGAYILEFRLLSWGGPGDWASFGDYVGGVLNPLIGVFTVVLIVLTLRATRREASDTREKMAQQIDLLKKEQVLGDMQKRLDGVLAEWNREMEQPLSDEFQPMKSMMNPTWRPVNFSAREILENRRIHSELMKAAKAHDEVAAQARYVAPSWKITFAHLMPLLSELDSYCIEYEQLTDSTRLTKYYKARVATAVRSLGTAGIMADTTYKRLTDLS